MPESAYELSICPAAQPSGRQATASETHSAGSFSHALASHRIKSDSAIWALNLTILLALAITRTRPSPCTSASTGADGGPAAHWLAGFTAAGLCDESWLAHVVSLPAHVLQAEAWRGRLGLFAFAAIGLCSLLTIWLRPKWYLLHGRNFLLTAARLLPHAVTLLESRGLPPSQLALGSKPFSGPLAGGHTSHMGMLFNAILFPVPTFLQAAISMLEGTLVVANEALRTGARPTSRHLLLFAAQTLICGVALPYALLTMYEHHVRSQLPFGADGATPSFSKGAAQVAPGEGFLTASELLAAGPGKAAAGGRRPGSPPTSLYSDGVSPGHQWLSCCLASLRRRGATGGGSAGASLQQGGRPLSPAQQLAQERQRWGMGDEGAQRCDGGRQEQAWGWQQQQQQEQDRQQLRRRAPLQQVQEAGVQLQEQRQQQQQQEQRQQQQQEQQQLEARQRPRRRQVYSSASSSASVAIKVHHHDAYQDRSSILASLHSFILASLPRAAHDLPALPPPAAAHPADPALLSTAESPPIVLAASAPSIVVSTTAVQGCLQVLVSFHQLPGSPNPPPGAGAGAPTSNVVHAPTPQALADTVHNVLQYDTEVTVSRLASSLAGRAAHRAPVEAGWAADAAAVAEPGLSVVADVSRIVLSPPCVGAWCEARQAVSVGGLQAGAAWRQLVAEVGAEGGGGGEGGGVQVEAVLGCWRGGQPLVLRQQFVVATRGEGAGQCSPEAIRLTLPPMLDVAPVEVHLLAACPGHEGALLGAVTTMALPPEAAQQLLTALAHVAAGTSCSCDGSRSSSDAANNSSSSSSSSSSCGRAVGNRSSSGSGAVGDRSSSSDGSSNGTSCTSTPPTTCAAADCFSTSSSSAPVGIASAEAVPAGPDSGGGGSSIITLAAASSSGGGGGGGHRSDNGVAGGGSSSGSSCSGCGCAGGGSGSSGSGSSGGIGSGNGIGSGGGGSGGCGCSTIEAVRSCTHLLHDAAAAWQLMEQQWPLEMQLPRSFTDPMLEFAHDCGLTRLHSYLLELFTTTNHRAAGRGRPPLAALTPTDATPWPHKSPPSAPSTCYCLPKALPPASRAPLPHPSTAAPRPTPSPTAPPPAPPGATPSVLSIPSPTPSSSHPSRTLATPHLTRTLTTPQPPAPHQPPRCVPVHPAPPPRCTFTEWSHQQGRIWDLLAASSSLSFWLIHCVKGAALTVRPPASLGLHPHPVVAAHLLLLVGPWLVLGLGPAALRRRRPLIHVAQAAAKGASCLATAWCWLPDSRPVQSGGGSLWGTVLMLAVLVPCFQRVHWRLQLLTSLVLEEVPRYLMLAAPPCASPQCTSPLCAAPPGSPAPAGPHVLSTSALHVLLLPVVTALVSWAVEQRARAAFARLQRAQAAKAKLA